MFQFLNNKYFISLPLFKYAKHKEIFCVSVKFQINNYAVNRMKFVYVNFMKCQNYKIALLLFLYIINCLFFELSVSQTV